MIRRSIKGNFTLIFSDQTVTYRLGLLILRVSCSVSLNKSPNV